MAGVTGLPTGGVGGTASTTGAGAGNGASGDASGAIGQMSAAFDQAISKAAEITAITTVKKAELDAAKQRPQN